MLTALQVRSSVYCVSDLGKPWGFEVEGAHIAKFHLVLQGACWLQVDGLDPVELTAGELVILPRGERHTVSDELASPVVALDRLIADHPLDAKARLRCHAAPGAQVIFAKLADVLLAQALRAYLAGAARGSLGRPRPRHDPQIEQAAALIRDQPARPWTLQALAREVGMSRTSLVARFRAATGESPMRHLARIRLGQAAGYLATADLSIAMIARRTGYASDASLSKAFKREFGTSPGAYRAGATWPASPGAGHGPGGPEP